MCCSDNLQHVEGRDIGRPLNTLQAKRRPLYIKPQSVPAVSTYHLCYKNQSVYAVSGTIRCLFSDKYKT